MTLGPRFVATKFTPKGRVKELEGSVLQPVGGGLKFVIAACSENGEISSPLYKTICSRFPKVKEDYRAHFVNRTLKLGNTQTSPIGSEVWVVQMFCLDKNNKVNKAALTECVAKLVEEARYEKATIHASELLFKEAPALKKMLTVDAPEQGIHLYIYQEPKETAKKQ